jgi:hypothetical protein
VQQAFNAQQVVQQVLDALSAHLHSADACRQVTDLALDALGVDADYSTDAQYRQVQAQAQHVLGLLADACSSTQTDAGAGSVQDVLQDVLHVYAHNAGKVNACTLLQVTRTGFASAPVHNVLNVALQADNSVQIVTD